MPFKNISLVDVDTSSASFSAWPAQLENINLAEIHNAFLKDCNGKYRGLINNLRNRTIWMINSTAVGGGVAEMLPMLIGMFEDVGVTIKWVVISPPSNVNQEAFFDLTKQMHNNIHGAWNPDTMEELGDKHRKILEEVCVANAEEFIPLVQPDDVIVIHDPQPLAMIKFIKQRLNNVVAWRCHIGVDFENDTVYKTWQFLKPYINLADHIIFSLPEYLPKYVVQEGRIPCSIIPPAICPFTPKNIGLSPIELLNVLSKSGVVYRPNLSEQWQHKAQRVCGKTGNLIPCSTAYNTNYELLMNPVLCEISRWDALKGWSQLIEAFTYVKKNPDKFTDSDMLKKMVLVLVGPDTKFVADDPEGIKVFNDLRDFYVKLGKTDKAIQDQIYIISAPMDNTAQNALIINALQRLSSIVIQNSIMEGFGLTVTEGLYKGTPIIASNVGGIKTQVFDQQNGVSIQNPRDYKSVAKAINTMVAGGKDQMKKYGIEGKKTVINKYLIWSQCRNYLDFLKQHVPSTASKL
eukprot:159423_1